MALLFNGHINGCLEWATLLRAIYATRQKNWDQELYFFLKGAVLPVCFQAWINGCFYWALKRQNFCIIYTMVQVIMKRLLIFKILQICKSCHSKIMLPIELSKQSSQLEKRSTNYDGINAPDQGCNRDQSSSYSGNSTSRYYTNILHQLSERSYRQPQIGSEHCELIKFPVPVNLTIKLIHKKVFKERKRSQDFPFMNYRNLTN